MERNEALAADLRRTAAQLAPEEMSLIDFDKVRESITSAADLLTAGGGDLAELAVIREDYEARIAGMLKAIAAVHRNRDRRDDAAEEALDLSMKSATELVACYRRTAARFRDSFPASFGLLQSGGTARHGSTHDLNDFK